MEVSKSNLYEKRKEPEAPPVQPVESAENLETLEQVRHIGNPVLEWGSFLGDFCPRLP